MKRTEFFELKGQYDDMFYFGIEHHLPDFRTISKEDAERILLEELKEVEKADAQRRANYRTSFENDY